MRVNFDHEHAALVLRSPYSRVLTERHLSMRCRTKARRPARKS
jgi:hypothetical protein